MSQSIDCMAYSFGELFIKCRQTYKLKLEWVSCLCSCYHAMPSSEQSLDRHAMYLLHINVITKYALPFTFANAIA
jgi:hypothetical protein